MRIAIHDSERETLKHKTFPNYALMKISAYHKSLGDTVEWFVPSEKYDRVYSSKVFDFTPENSYLPPDTIKGGTGYDVYSTLPAKIESCYPDYSIYPECDYAIGYITRGCPNHCRWCVVPEKEWDIKPYRTWRQLVRPDTDKLVLMDNNILACEYGINQLESLIDSGYKIDLNQGMDARLVTDRIARILSKLQWIRHIRFSCDSIPQIDAIIHAAELLQKYGVKPYKLFVYLLVTPDLENAAYRVEKLKQLKGINLYAQAERNVRKGIVPNKEQLEFAQRYVYSGKYRSETWQEYCQRKNESRALTIKPITLKAANDFVKQFHRHNLPTVGCKFAIACYNGKTLCGVAICGRPTARNADDGKTVEIYRNCTDGTYNACSKLYGACVKVSKDMGYERVITYILDSENGASVLASNFTFDGRAGLPEQTGSRQKCRAVAPKEYKKRYVYNIVPPDNKEEKTMVWDGKALSAIVKEHLYNLFSDVIAEASAMNNKEYADLLKKKYNNSGQSGPDKKAYIHTRSKGIAILFKEPLDKAILNELDGDNVIEISWTMAARQIRAWESEKKTEDINADKPAEKEKAVTIKPVLPIGGFNLTAFTSQNNQLKIMPIDMLVPYRNHKFKLYEGERLNDMVQSVKTNGILTPILVRAIDGGDKYEILAGHNRTNAARLAGLTSIPAVVKENLSDEEAEMYVVETNVMQRGFDDLSITERAAVVAARHSAMFDEDKRRAIERELALLGGEEVEEQDEGGEKKSKLAAVGENYGLGKDSVARLVRVDKLVDELKPYVDDGGIAIRAAVNLSYLSQNEQTIVAELMDLGMDMKKAALLREVSKQKKLTAKAIRDIMYRGELIDKDAPIKRKPIKVKINADITEKYFDPEWDESKVQEVVEEALELYFANGE